MTKNQLLSLRIAFGIGVGAVLITKRVAKNRERDRILAEDHDRRVQLFKDAMINMKASEEAFRISMEAEPGDVERTYLNQFAKLQNELRFKEIVKDF